MATDMAISGHVCISRSVVALSHRPGSVPARLPPDRSWPTDSGKLTNWGWGDSGSRREFRSQHADAKFSTSFTTKPCDSETHLFIFRPMPQQREKEIQMSKLLLTLASLLIIINASPVHACTVMRLNFDGRLLVARNHDWYFGNGLLVVNQPGIRKTAISAVRPAKWVSKYGSVSFVQFGREIPFAGMNQQGLTVDLLQLDEARFPVPDQQTSVNVVQWVQFQLDTAKNVDEVVASLGQVRPAPMMPTIERVHYFVTDASGDVAVIEFLGGRPVIQRGTEAAKCALANSTWSDSFRMLNKNRRSGSDRRYASAVESVRQIPDTKNKDEQVEYGFDSLKLVSQRSTQWSIVYEPKEHRLWLETRAATQRRWIDLDDLLFSVDEPTLIIDVNADHAGPLKPHLEPYTSKANGRLVNFAFAELMPEGFARMAIKQLVISYPATLIPVDPTPTKQPEEVSP